MKSYRVYGFSYSGHITEAGLVAANSEDDAIVLVRAGRPKQKCELWDGNRHSPTYALTTQSDRPKQTLLAPVPAPPFERRTLAQGQSASHAHLVPAPWPAWRRPSGGPPAPAAYGVFQALGCTRHRPDQTQPIRPSAAPGSSGGCLLPGL